MRLRITELVKSALLNDILSHDIDILQYILTSGFVDIGKCQII